MWPFTDPVECEEAKQFLAYGQVLEAARVLLPAKAGGHKAVRQLLMQIAPHLVEEAQRAFDEGQLNVAADLLDCAGRCAELSLQARTLRNRIEQLQNEQRMEQDWQEQRIQQADRWAKAGRLNSALGMIEPITDNPHVGRRRIDWQHDSERLDRYVTEFRAHLVRTEFPAAELILRKVRELAPHQPLVLCLEAELQAARFLPKVPLPNLFPLSGNPCHTNDRMAPENDDRKQDDQPPVQSVPTSLVTPRILLSGLSQSGRVLMLRQPIITIGSAKETTIDLPIQAYLRRRHAVLIREQATGPSGARHRIVPMAGATVLVNDTQIPDCATRWLCDGDIVWFGLKENHCGWRYRRRIADSATALFEQSQPGGAEASLPSVGQIRRIVLLDAEVIIGRDRRENHLVEPAFAVSQLRLKFASQGCNAAFQQGKLFVNGHESLDEPDGGFHLPAELSLYADGPELLTAALQGKQAMNETLTLTRV